MAGGPSLKEAPYIRAALESVKSQTTLTPSIRAAFFRKLITKSASSPPQFATANDLAMASVGQLLHCFDSYW